MEKLFNDKDKITKRLIKEAGIQSPSADFSKELLKQIEVRQKVMETAPLLSNSGWLVVSLVILASGSLLYFFPPELIQLIDKLPFETNTWNVSFNEINIPKNMLYAFLFLSLFLLQIPILKKTLEKRL